MSFSVQATLLAIVKLIFKILKYPLTLLHLVIKFAIELFGSILFFPLFVLVNMMQRIESLKILEGDMNSPVHQMTLALPKLLLTLLNFASYLMCPALPIFIATTHDFAYNKPAILHYGQKPNEH